MFDQPSAGGAVLFTGVSTAMTPAATTIANPPMRETTPPTRRKNGVPAKFGADRPSRANVAPTMSVTHPYAERRRAG